MSNNFIAGVKPDRPFTGPESEALRQQLRSHHEFITKLCEALLVADEPRQRCKILSLVALWSASNGA